MIQFIVVDEISLGPAREVLGLGFVIGYCPQPEVLRDWFSPIYIEVKQPDNYFSPRLLVWFDRADRGS